MNPKLVRVAKWVGYPLFYLFCLGLFAYFTFPYDALKDRLISEYELDQRAHGGDQRLSIDHLTSYWFTGAEATGVKLTIPAGAAGGDDAVVEIDSLRARVQILPLLIGRVKVNFKVEAFGGVVEGSARPPLSKDADMELSAELTDIDLAQTGVLAAYLGAPVRGVLGGTISLEAPEGKLANADGAIDLRMTNTSLGDGEAKVMDKLPLPKARLGEVVLTGEIKKGSFALTALEAKGPDVLLVAEGNVQLRDPAKDSIADLYARFKFSDDYRKKDDITKSLLGEPGSKLPALLDLDPKAKKAKRADGFYGWHLHGAVRNLRFDPSAEDIKGDTTATSTKGRPSPFRAKSGATEALPLGPSRAVPAEREVPARERSVEAEPVQDDSDRTFQDALPNAAPAAAAPSVLIVGARPTAVPAPPEPADAPDLVEPPQNAGMMEPLPEGPEQGGDDEGDPEPQPPR